MKKRNFSAEFRRESAQLVVDQHYTVADAANAMNVGLSTMTRWVCEHTRFSSTYFLRFLYFQLITCILPVSDYSGNHANTHSYQNQHSKLKDKVTK